MIDSLFSRNTRIVCWQVILNVPSIPDTSMADVSMRVRRNGTFSGCFCGVEDITVSNFLREAIAGRDPPHLSLHRDFKAVTEVDVDNPATDSVHEQV